MVDPFSVDAVIYKRRQATQPKRSVQARGAKSTRYVVMTVRVFSQISFSKDPDTKLALTNDQRPLFIRGTQRGYCSKPLKHSIVKQILVFKR